MPLQSEFTSEHGATLLPALLKEIQSIADNLFTAKAIDTFFIKLQEVDVYPVLISKIFIRLANSIENMFK